MITVVMPGKFMLLKLLNLYLNYYRYFLDTVTCSFKSAYAIKQGHKEGHNVVVKNVSLTVQKKEAHLDMHSVRSYTQRLQFNLY